MKEYRWRIIMIMILGITSLVAKCDPAITWGCIILINLYCCTGTILDKLESIRIPVDVNMKLKNIDKGINVSMDMDKEEEEENQ